MTRDETIELFDKCEAARKEALDADASSDEAHEKAKAIWNGWAESLLAQKEELVAQEEWDHRARIDFSDVSFQVRDDDEPLSELSLTTSDTEIRCDEYLFPGDVCFDGSRFGADATFKHAVFEGNATFARVAFEAISDFQDTVFKQQAYFVSATFNGIALFTRATFKRPALFVTATFRDYGQFLDAVFEDDVSFVQATFDGYTTFGRANFGRKETSNPGAHANFTAIRADRTFNLAGAVFVRVPDFAQANFREAPRLDNVSVSTPDFMSKVDGKDALSIDDEAKYRALKRMAIQDHDHDSELKFLKSEKRAAWKAADHRWHPRWWLQIAYDLISDYGKSIARPFTLWVSLWLLSAITYFVEATHTCGVTESAFAALRLAGRNALPAVGLHLRFEAAEAYQCLYGYAGIQDSLPITVQMVGPVHAFLSVVLIFLLALGLRNKFRIK